MKLPLSDRLLACAGFVKPGDRVADVGCDHGYLGIHLLKNHIASSIIASDVKEQPLQSAIHNAVKFGVQDKMTFYLSDGVRNIPRDFDCMVCAGMGADTIMSIIHNSAEWLKDSRYTASPRLPCCVSICLPRAGTFPRRPFCGMDGSSTPLWKFAGIRMNPGFLLEKAISPLPCWKAVLLI